MNINLKLTIPKILIASFLFLASTVSFGQIEKGYYLLGGSANASGAPTQSPLGNVKFGTFSWNVRPQAGVFIKDGLALGSNITLGQSFSANTRNSTIAIGPFGRYYFLPIEREVNLFAQTGFGLGTNISNNIRQDSYYWLAAFGPAFFINRSIAFETTLSYNYSGSNGFSSHRFALNFGFQIHFNPSIPVE